jgi:hypothetical protein
MKKVTRWLGALALVACLFGTERAVKADFAPITIPTDSTGAPLFNVWGPIAQSNVSYPSQCVFGIPCAPGDFVRGQVTLRHARDRIFYNTTSNRGYYWRSLSLTCSDFQTQFAPGGPFSTDADADLTLFCTGTSYFSGSAGITSI